MYKVELKIAHCFFIFTDVIRHFFVIIIRYTYIFCVYTTKKSKTDENNHKKLLILYS